MSRSEEEKIRKTYATDSTVRYHRRGNDIHSSRLLRIIRKLRLQDEQHTRGHRYLFQDISRYEPCLSTRSIQHMDVHPKTLLQNYRAKGESAHLCYGAYQRVVV